MDDKDRDYTQRDTATLSYLTFRPATRDNCSRWRELVANGMSPQQASALAPAPTCDTGACGK